MTLILLVALSGIIATCGFMLIGLSKDIEELKKSIECLEEEIYDIREEVRTYDDK